jgi:hypothetical protein
MMIEDNEDRFYGELKPSIDTQYAYSIFVGVSKTEMILTTARLLAGAPRDPGRTDSHVTIRALSISTKRHHIPVAVTPVSHAPH